MKNGGLLVAAIFFVCAATYLYFFVGGDHLFSELAAGVCRLLASSVLIVTFVRSGSKRQR